MHLIAAATMTFLAASIFSLNAPKPGSASAHERLMSLGWLSGHWKGEGFETFYTSPEGGIILSLSKGFADGNVTFTEYEKIHIKGDDVLLTPHIEGQKPVSFTLTGYDPDVKRASFRNMKHDFPKEIAFDLSTPDTLVIVLKGEEGGKEQVMRLNLARVR